MSNLIKHFQTTTAKPFIIDANKSAVIKKIEEQVAIENQSVQQMDENGFSFGLSAEQIEVEDQPQAASASMEDAHQAVIIINEAYIEADEIRQNAVAEVENAKQEACESARQEGYAQGLKQAEQEYNEKAEQLQQEFSNKKNELELQLQDEIKQLEPQFVDLMCKLLTKLTGVVCEEDKDVLLYLIQCGIQECESSKEYVIQVSESDYEKIYARREEIISKLPQNVTCEIIQDHSLNTNECVIETQHGILDVSIAVQTEQLVKQLRMLSI